MAEQTEITNVGGEGVASEVTLANLLAVTEQMAKKLGLIPKTLLKTQSTEYSNTRYYQSKY